MEAATAQIAFCGPRRLRSVGIGLRNSSRVCFWRHGRIERGWSSASARLGEALRPTLSGALVVARTQVSPRQQMTRGGEAAHVDADLGDDGFGAEFLDAGVGAYDVDGDAKGPRLRLRLRGPESRARRRAHRSAADGVSAGTDDDSSRSPAAPRQLLRGLHVVDAPRLQAGPGLSRRPPRRSRIARPLFPSMSESSASILRLASSNTL